MFFYNPYILLPRLALVSM